MIGAIIGDIVGSVYEFDNHRSKVFELFKDECFFTDDTVMTIAIGKALRESNLENDEDVRAKAIDWMRFIGQKYPFCGYGGRFDGWMFSDNPQPYNSFGNGAAMKVSACAEIAGSLDEALHLSKLVTEVTHNHPEGIKGAQATAAAAYLAKTGHSREQIRRHIEENYYRLDFTIDGIRDTYRFNETCQGTVPQALEAFFESDDFEDAIRTAISVGGDSDTLAAITGAVAESYYGVPEKLRAKALTYLDDNLLALLEEAEGK